MPITVDWNGAYGPPLVTQKYRPLDNPVYRVEDLPIYSGLLLQRDSLLRASGRWPAQLRLTAQNWGPVDVAENVAGRLPPLVVVSSNRSAWIAAGLTVARNRAGELGINVFGGVQDMRALTSTAGQSPPLYAFERVGLHRGIYIVVHDSEFVTYRDALRLFPQVVVIGWSFRFYSGRRKGRWSVAGFGASRYAAIEFCKHLRANTGNRWDLAWLLDDNVVALANLPGLASIEAALVAPGGPRVAAALHGGTNVLTRDTIRAAAANAPAPVNPPVATPTPGIIQQASLWNIAYLAANNLNFGVTYVASAEDLSFGSYFDTRPIPYLYYNGIGVRKEVVANHDNSRAAADVNTLRDGMTRFFADAEMISFQNTAAPPTPLFVQQPGQGAGRPQHVLGTFVTDYVLPNANDAIRALQRNESTRNAARCQAVEQLTSGALGRNFVDVPARAATFTAVPQPPRRVTARPPRP